MLKTGCKLQGISIDQYKQTVQTYKRKCLKVYRPLYPRERFQEFGKKKIFSSNKTQSDKLVEANEEENDNTKN